MRNVVNISLPYTLTAEVETAVEQGRFASKSEFFRHLLRLWLENRLVSDLEKSRKEMVFGKGKVLRSLKDLR